jgi:hypothetical protein
MARAHTLTWLVLVAIPSGCGPERTPDFSEVQRRAIVGGTDDSGHFSVGLLESSHGQCSATLIGRRTVLTAAHCVSESPYKTATLPLTFSPMSSVRFDAESAVVTPSTVSLTERDLAVVRLTKKVPGVVPSLLSQQAPVVGEPITLVGLGMEGETTWLVKRVGTNTIYDVEPSVILFNRSTGACTCSGDSGGPTFADRGGKEAIISVHSASTGAGANCEKANTTGYDTRVDVFLSWITQQAAGDLYKGETIDTTPPKVKILSPSAGEVSRTVAVKVSATDDVGVTKVVLKLDGVEHSHRESPPFDFEIADLSRGHAYSIEAVAYDDEENTASDKIDVKVQAAGAFAASCSVDADCASSLCREGICTQSCSPSKECPTAYSCVETVCKAASGGGCSVGGTGHTTGTCPLLLVALGALLGARRRRARSGARRRGIG